MMEEYKSIMKKYVWEVVLEQKGWSMVTSKWIYKLKHVVDHNIEKYKAIFLARGLSKKQGIVYVETFSPMER